MAIRKIGIASRAYRHVNRYRQILTILIKYGFADLVDRLRIAQTIEVGWQLVSRRHREQVAQLTTPQRVRKVLEELGPTSMKLGQVLSTRPDLLPPEFVEELAKLRQQAQPFPFDDVRRIVEAELGAPLDQVFERFDEQSIAAASIGQVHRALLRGGEEVVVKVQRPDIAKVVEVDLEILLHLATLLERHVEGFALQRPSRIVEEFSRVIEKELDFRAEAAHIERFARQFYKDATIYVPKVFHEATTRRVLTLEYVCVTPIDNQERLRKEELSPKTLAARGADLTLRQIFVHGFFHADPHPGNIFALPGNVVCLLDFGMMGRLDRHTRERFADLILAIGARDTPRTVIALLRVAECDDEDEPDERGLERDVSEFIDLHIPEKLGDLNFDGLLREVLALIGRHRLRIPADLVMMLKAAAEVESLAARLDPELNMVKAAAPYLRRIRFERLRPTRLLREAYESGGELMDLAREIPGNIRDILRLARRGGVKIGFEHRGLNNVIDSNERIANRVSFSIVVAALLVGSSVIVHSRIPPKWNEIPIVGLVGFVAAGVMGFVLLIAIIRHGRL